MRLLLIALIILAGLVLSGCESDPENIQDVWVEVRVVDAVTDTPIQGAEVLIGSVYSRLGFGRSKGDTLVQVITGAAGVVKAHLVHAYAVGVAAQATNYLPNRRKHEVKQKTLLITLPLHKSKPNPTLRKHLYYSLSISDDADLGPIHSNDLLKTEVGSPVQMIMDYRYRERDFKVPDSYGINLSNARTSRDTSVCDLWLEPGANDSQPTKLVAGGKGGIVPIYNSKYSQSVLLDYDEAPATGYYKRYIVTGKENGFFIRTRDGEHYGKFFLTGTWSNFQASAYDENEPDCEYRWQGSSLFQANGSRNLSIDSARVNLIHFLRRNIP